MKRPFLAVRGGADAPTPPRPLLRNSQLELSKGVLKIKPKVEATARRGGCARLHAGGDFGGDGGSCGGVGCCCCCCDRCCRAARRGRCGRAGGRGRAPQLAFAAASDEPRCGRVLCRARLSLRVGEGCRDAVCGCRRGSFQRLRVRTPASAERTYPETRAHTPVCAHARVRPRTRAPTQSRLAGVCASTCPQTHAAAARRRLFAVRAIVCVDAARALCVAAAERQGDEAPAACWRHRGEETCLAACAQG
eukprot:1647557-Pleurochrysis_carterae.AAC.1